MAPKIVRWAREIRRFRPEITPEPDFCSPARVAQRFRGICSKYGAAEIAASVHAPPEVEDFRVIAYLFAHATAPDDSIELCVEQGIHGLHEFEARSARG